MAERNDIVVQRILDRIAREFKIDPKINGSIMGRSIEEIEKSKSFSAKSTCPEVALLVAHRLQSSGIPSEIIVQRTKTFIGTKVHFMAGYTSGDRQKTIKLNKGLQIVENNLANTKKVTYERHKFNLSPKDSLKSLFTKQKMRMYLEILIHTISPKYIELSLRKSKREKKARQKNNLLKYGIKAP